MGTKADAPKLTPAERLARKRAAARLRQQRCRARKRQAMLEKKRDEVDRQRRAKLTHDAAPRPPIVMRGVQHPPRSLFPAYKPVHSAKATTVPWVGAQGKLPTRPPMMKSTSEPIYNCVSFDSQKSLEESRQKVSREASSPPRSPAQKSPTLVTPTSQASSPPKLAVFRTISEEKGEGPLVQEEEAAVMAMLSLKSGPTTPSDKSEKSEDNSNQQTELPSQSPPREVVISHKPTAIQTPAIPGAVNSEQTQHNSPKHIVRPQAPRRMVPRLYDYEAYTYGHPMKVPPHARRAQVPPGYYRVHAPLPPPHPHYARYHYPSAPRFVAYEYE